MELSYNQEAPSMQQKHPRRNAPWEHPSLQQNSPDSSGNLEGEINER